MKIPLKYVYHDGEPSSLNKYIKLLFHYLERDKKFEELIVNARDRLSINIPLLKEEDKLEIITAKIKPLRSETAKLPSTRKPHISIETDKGIKMDKETDSIIKAYPFLQDWRKGLRGFIVGDPFEISNENTSIKLRVKSRQFSYVGRYTDRDSEEGVKIVISSNVSKKEIKDWIDSHYSLIQYYLDYLPNLSKQSTIRENFERDRLVVYLKSKWNMTYKEIADILTDGSNENSLQKAYEDFPYH